MELACASFVLAMCAMPLVAIWLGRRARQEDSGKSRSARQLAFFFFYGVLNVSMCTMWGAFRVAGACSPTWLAGALVIVNLVAFVPISNFAHKLPPPPKKPRVARAEGP